MSSTMRIAMLISGTGTTMREIIRATKDGRLSQVQPVLVIASTPTAAGIVKARDEGVPKQDILVLERKAFGTSESFGRAIIAACRRRGVDFIGQYGWLVKTPRNVIGAYQDMMVNQHPGPLDPGRPDFGGPGMYGRRVHSARIFFTRVIGRDFFTEATAQRVHPEYDQGAVLGRRLVRISYFPRETTESLAKKVLPEEHTLHIDILRAFSEDHERELSRPGPLVHPHEVPILEEAKRVAKSLFPFG